MAGLSYIHSKVGRRLVVLTVLFSSLITLVLTCVQLAIEYSEEMHKHTDNQQIIAGSLLHSLGESVWTYDDAQIALQLQGIVNMPTIEHAVLQLPEGGRFEVGLVSSQIIDKTTFSVPYLVEGSHSIIATLTIASGMDETYWSLARLAGLLLVSNGAKATLVILFMLYLLDRLIGRQMRQVIDYLQHYQQGKTSERLVLEGPFRNTGDEIDLLAESLNDMQQRIHQEQQLALKESRKREKIQQQLFLQNEQLLQLERQLSLGEMASTLAHELNQPLTSVIGYSDICRRLIKQPNVDMAAISSGLEHLSDNAERAASLIRRTRDAVKSRGYFKEYVEATALLEHGSQLVAHNLAERQVQLTVQPVSEPLWLYVDKAQMEQVIINLLRNAMDALETQPEEQRRIMVAIDEVADCVRINIIDNGCGLPAELDGELFRPFVTSKKEGYGVGLAISQGIVEAMGGAISAHNEILGGSRFCITLPRCEAPESLSCEAPESLSCDAPESLSSEAPESLSCDAPESLSSEAPDSIDSDAPEDAGKSAPAELEQTPSTEGDSAELQPTASTSPETENESPETVGIVRSSL